MTDHPGPTVSPAAESDIPVILSFIRQLAEYERLAHEVIATEASLRQHLFGPRPAAEALVAKIDERAIGFALYFATFSTFAGRAGIWLEDLFVVPEYRRQGVGKALLREVASIALRRGCGRLEWSVLDWNEPAVALYRSMGAVPMSDWTTQRVTGDALSRLAASSPL